MPLGQRSAVYCLWACSCFVHGGVIVTDASALAAEAQHAAAEAQHAGRGSTEERVIPLGSQTPTPAHEGSWVEVQGIVRRVRADAQSSVLRLALNGGRINVRVVGVAAAELTHLIDADTRVRGIWSRMRRSNGQFGDRELVLHDISGIRLVREGVPDPFALPLARFEDVARLVETKAHRLLVRGTVVRQRFRTIYLTDQKTLLQVQSTEEFQPGDELEVAGFAAGDPLAPWLRDTDIRLVGRRAPPIPARLTPSGILDASPALAFVQIDAELLRFTRNGNRSELLVRADGVMFEATVPGPVDGAGIEPGSWLQLTGIVETRGGPPPTFRLRLTSVADVVSISAPVWWTIQRMLLVVVVTSGVGLGLLGWVIALRRRLPRTERALRASEARYRMIFEHGPAATYVADAEGVVVACNLAFAQLLRVATPSEAIGSRMASLCQTPAAREAHVSVITPADPHATHEMTVTARGGCLVPVRESVVGMFAADGRLEGFQGFLVDLTEQRQAEAALLRKEAQLQHAQKMEALGRLAGGVAHDFNNLLTAILGYAQLLKQGGQPDDMLVYADEVERAAETAAGVTRQLLAFSRKQVCTPSVIDVNATVVQLEKLLRRTLGEDIMLRFQLTAERAHVLADPSHLEQVLLNLAVNARDAMPNGGHLRIITRVETQTVQLVVEDTGMGIQPDVLPHIFEPFFTTKEAGKGTGLGLAIVYGVVTQNGGAVSIESEPGRGTRVSISVPRTTAPVTTAGPTPVESRRGHERILLVEDESSLRRYVTRILERAGYEVVAATDGEDALARASHISGPLHLLLTDVVMPKVKGPELAQQLRSLRPELPVILMSGYADHPALDAGTSLLVLAKPFRAEALLDAVRRAIDSTADSAVA